MSTAAIDRLIAQMRDQRKSWVELEPATATAPAKRVQIIRPAESDLAGMIAPAEDPGVSDGGVSIRVDMAEVKRFTVGWDGITEADLVGAAGSADALDFSADLWAEVVADRVAWKVKVARAILGAITAHRLYATADAGN